jgi:ABC-type multidrug transport system ATPase subunit
VESTASRIALIANGQLHANATPDALLASLQGQVWEWTVPAAQVADAQARYLVSGMLRRGDGVQLRIVASQAPGADARPAVPSLEDAYLQLLQASRATVAA